MTRAGLRLTAGALAIALSATGQSPDFAEYVQAVRDADTRLSRNDFEGVIDNLETWPEKFPDRPEASHFLGLAHYGLRQFESAIGYLAGALEMERPDSAAWKQTVEILGAAYYFRGMWREAEPLLEKAAHWRPDDSELLYTLAMSHLHLGHRDRALQEFAKVFRVDPDSPRALLLAGNLMYRENRLSDATALLREALKMEPGLPGASYRLGVIAVRQGDYQGAVELLGHELERQPHDAAGWHSLGEALSGRGRLAEAVEALKRAVWLDPSAAASYLLLAKTYMSLNQLGLAEDAVGRALRVSPQSYEAHYLSGRIYYKTGRMELARKQLAAAESLRRTAVKGGP